jgi:hypothetical protein
MSFARIMQPTDGTKVGHDIRVRPPASARTLQVPPGREFLQRPSSVPDMPATVNHAVRSPGQVLPGELRGELESAFAFDFSQVRVHTDRQAELSAGALGARAYTVANHVVFGPGTYAPETADGKRLIAHELAHVVQQSDAHVPSRAGSLSIDCAPEIDADQAADAAVRHPPVHARSGPGGSHLPVAAWLARSATHSAVVQRQAAPAATTIPMKVVPHGASEAAVKAAEAQLREVLGTLKAANLAQVKGETIELHIIPANKKLTELPEYANLKGVRTWDKKRVYDEIRGAGAEKIGSVIRYAIAEEQLVKVPGHAMGYAPGFVGTHESGHVVQQFALTKGQSDDLTAAYNARVKAGGPWLGPAWYTRGNVSEYFAQGTAAYLGHPYSTSDKDKKTYTKDWLRKNDPALFKLLDEIYGAGPAPHLPPSFRPRTDFNDKMQKDLGNL